MRAGCAGRGRGPTSPGRFLTLGIALGSWWAYYELGWGGWWFWDPVENASFMPWLVGAALLHSQAVTEKRGSFRGWTLLLAIAAFSLSLLGTFLVRSGVLTSVHAFAADPTRGLFILIFLGIVIGGSLLLYALRAPARATRGGSRSPPTRAKPCCWPTTCCSAAACAMVLLGTLYPLLADALDLGKISVGPPYFAPAVHAADGAAGAAAAVRSADPLAARAGRRGRWRMLLPWAGAGAGAGAIAAYFLAPQGPLEGRRSASPARRGSLLGTLRFVWTRLQCAAGSRFTGRDGRHDRWRTSASRVFLVGALLVEG